MVKAHNNLLLAIYLKVNNVLVSDIFIADTTYITLYKNKNTRHRTTCKQEI